MRILLSIFSLPNLPSNINHPFHFISCLAPCVPVMAPRRKVLSTFQIVWWKSPRYSKCFLDRPAPPPQVPTLHMPRNWMTCYFGKFSKLLDASLLYICCSCKTHVHFCTHDHLAWVHLLGKTVESCRIQSDCCAIAMGKGPMWPVVSQMLQWKANPFLTHLGQDWLPKN